MQVKKLDDEQVFTHTITRYRFQVNKTIVRVEKSVKADSIFDDYDTDIEINALDKQNLTEKELEALEEALEDLYN